ncbi:DUF262 domain-containing protein [Skermanella sp. TT6]|uniref:DUF262 domain-containing protein n=1 Tax=Skermanella cutis TaxID=2775420 RepID=A0ABX7B2X9_9PROT|nr:DUF262 domain-containing protein [Skermanella sp. TT6]QQP88693.2 DUF262 domain-containing protein [Skermanella sp. TT6]
MPGSKFVFKDMGLGLLLKQGRLVVPANQRPYAWEDKHVLDLFRDLHETITNDEDEYFLGTVVLIQTGNEIPSIADGQQRIATTTVLLCRIRDKLLTLGRDGRARSIDDTYLRNIDMETENIVPRISLNIEDNDYFIQHILPSPKDDGYDILARRTSAVRPSNERLLTASRLAEEFIEDILKPLRQESHADYLAKWVKFIENNATVVVVYVPDEIGAFRIFETLNDRGLKASQADILKNFLFSKAGSRLEEAKMMWNTTTSVVESISDDANERLVTYIRHLLVLWHGPTKERELADRVKKTITGQTKAIDFLSNSSTSAIDYAALWSSTHPKWNSYKASTSQYVHTINEHLKVEQIRPLMFAVARHFDPVETDKAFRLFVSWSVRFLIFGGRGGMLDLQYSLRAQDVGTKKITKARELREAMKKYVPTDKEFEDAFATARVSREHLARYYLRAMENKIKEDPQPEYVANEDKSQINLEHVLPMNPGPDWGIDSEVAQSAQKMLGNMVLLQARKNKGIGNSGFSEKKATLAESGYYLTRMVAQYDEWGIDQIRARQAELAKTAVQTWSLDFAD